MAKSSLAPRWLHLSVAVVLLLATCAGCGDGPAVRARQQRIEDPVRPLSVSARVGTLRLLAIAIQKPTDGKHLADDSAYLFLTIANDGAKDDTLTAVTAVDARRVLLREGDGQPTGRVRIEIPAGRSRSLQAPADLHLELAGLERDIGVGEFIPVTFRFERAGAVTAHVFVQVTDWSTPTATATGAG